jgi:hypothetical protein
MATTYEVIYERFLNRIEDFELANLPSNDLREMCHTWLTSAIAKFRKCKNDLKDRDDELAQFNVDLEDEEIEILSILMNREWVSQQLHSVLLTRQMYSGKEQNYYSQAQHMKELMDMDNRLKIEAQKLSRDYTFANDVKGYFGT